MFPGPSGPSFGSGRLRLFSPEVVQKSLVYGVEGDGLRMDLEALGLRILAFTPEEAEMAACVWQKTRPYGLSLGDRACLSLGLRLGLPILTTDRAWLKVQLSIAVHVLR